MVSVKVKKTGKLAGTVQAPPSKSYTHRSIIAASLAEGMSRILAPLYCDDTETTIRLCSRLGAEIESRGSDLMILGTSRFKSINRELDCDDSASTLRFLTPLTAYIEGKTVLTGSRGLRRRPVGPLIGAMNDLGVKCFSEGGFPPVTVLNGGIDGGEASIVGNVSSQFITGLLLACPMAFNDTELVLTTPLESKPYVELTVDVISKHSISVEFSEDLRYFRIPKSQKYHPNDHVVPGDFSSSAFLLAAAAMTDSKVKVDNLSPNQPDREIVNILKMMGVDIKICGRAVEVFGGELIGAEIDASDVPDLVPAVSALACVAKGVTKIYNAKRLRIKESNRLNALTSELVKMGGDIEESEEMLTIRGPCKLSGTTINPYGDHRIAMACTVAALGAEGETVIHQAESVNKSYPNFFRDLKSIGAKIIVK